VRQLPALLEQVFGDHARELINCLIGQSPDPEASGKLRAIRNQMREM
jgi:hypothetical protein